MKRGEKPGDRTIFGSLPELGPSNTARIEDAVRTARNNIIRIVVEKPGSMLGPTIDRVRSTADGTGVETDLYIFDEREPSKTLGLLRSLFESEEKDRGGKRKLVVVVTPKLGDLLSNVRGEGMISLRRLFNRQGTIIISPIQLHEGLKVQELAQTTLRFNIK